MTRVVTSYGSGAEIHVKYLYGRGVFLASVGTCDKAIHLRNYTRFNKFLGGGCVTGILKLGAFLQSVLPNERSDLGMLTFSLLRFVT